MLRIDPIAMCRVADTVAIDTNIQRLRHPITRNAAQRSAQAVDVAGRRAAVVVDVAGQPGAVLGVPDQEDAFDGGEGGAGELGEGVDGGGGALGVPLEDEAFGGGGGEGGADFVDDLGSACQWSL